MAKTTPSSSLTIVKSRTCGCCSWPLHGGNRSWPDIPKGTGLLISSEQSSVLSVACPLWCCRVGVASAHSFIITIIINLKFVCSQPMASSGTCVRRCVHTGRCMITQTVLCMWQWYMHGRHHVLLMTYTYTCTMHAGIGNHVDLHQPLLTLGSNCSTY